MAKQFTSDSPTIEEIMRVKKPREKTVDVFLDPSQASDAYELAVQIQIKSQTPARKGKSLAESNPAKEIEKMEDELARLIEEAEVVTFTFRDIGRKAFDKIVRDYPATDLEKKEWKDAGNEGQPPGDEFIAALIASTCINPVMTIAQAQSLSEQWSQADVEMLFVTAMAVCRDPVTIPFSRRASEKTPTTESKSNTVQPTESDTQTS